jgi:hypothetical protein
MLRSVHVEALKGGGGGIAKTSILNGFSSSVGSFIGVEYTSAGVPV